MEAPRASSQARERPKGKRGGGSGSGNVGLFHAQGAAESDTSVRLRVGSHVPGRKRDRAQVDEAGIRKAKPPIETPSVEPAPAPAGESADGPSSRRVRPMNRLRRTPEGNATLLGFWTGGEQVRTSTPLNRLFWVRSRAWRGSAREVPCRRSMEVLWRGREEGLTAGLSLVTLHRFPLGSFALAFFRLPSGAGRR